MSGAVQIRSSKRGINWQVVKHAHSHSKNDCRSNTHAHTVSSTHLRNTLPIQRRCRDIVPDTYSIYYKHNNHHTWHVHNHNNITIAIVIVMIVIIILGSNVSVCAIHCCCVSYSELFFSFSLSFTRVISVSFPHSHFVYCTNDVCMLHAKHLEYV